MGKDLSELPLWSVQEAREKPYGRTVCAMVGSGLWCCGFRIFRCVYGDDGDDITWARFLDTMKRQTHDYVWREARQALAEYLNPALKWTVVEDAPMLANATKEQVRRRYIPWREE